MTDLDMTVYVGPDEFVTRFHRLEGCATRGKMAGDKSAQEMTAREAIEEHDLTPCGICYSKHRRASLMGYER